MNIQGLTSPAVLNVKGISDLLSKLNLNIGDKISVQVVGINSNELTLKLQNGAEIKAVMLMPMDVNLGDYLDLSVKGKSDSQIVLETVKGTQFEPAKNDLTNILSSLKITPDERNINIAKNIVNQNLPINKEVFQKVVNTMAKFDFDINRAVFFVANNFENSIDADILSKYADSSQKLSHLVNHLSSKINIPQNNEAFNEVVSNYNKAVLIENIKNIANNNNAIHEDISSFNGSSSQINTLAKNIAHNLIDIYKFVSQKDFIGNDMPELKDVKALLPMLKNEIANILNSDSKSAINHEIKEILSQNASDEKLINILPKIDKDITEFVKNNRPLKQELLKVMNDLSSTVLRYGDNIFNQSTQNKGVVDLGTKIKDFFNIPIFKGIVNKEDQIDIGNLLNQLNDKLDVIKEAAQKGSFNNNSEILNVVNEIKNSINFMTNVNNTFNFYQIPMFMNRANNDFEVYVAKRDRNSKIDPRNVTLYISLDTKNLGIVESLITINYEKIDFSFKLEDENTINLFKKYQGLLEDLMNNKGYTINKLSFNLSSQKTNILSFDQVLKEHKISRNIVDIKV